MAIDHLRVKIIERSKSKNVIDSAAYRCAAKFFNEHEQRHFDHRRKKNVIYGEIMVPANAPHWIAKLAANKPCLSEQEIAKSANGLKILCLVIVILAHKNDGMPLSFPKKRRDLQLAREVEFALPVELDVAQNLVLAREYIHDEFMLRGMVADWSIH